MAYLRYLFYGVLAGGPFALLTYQRLVHTYEQDPLNWEYGNHGPWWNGWEHGYLFLNFLLFLCVCLAEGIAMLRVWKSDGQFIAPVGRGCGASLFLFLIFLAQMPIVFSMY